MMEKASTFSVDCKFFRLTFKSKRICILVKDWSAKKMSKASTLTSFIPNKLKVPKVSFTHIQITIVQFISLQIYYDSKDSYKNVSLGIAFCVLTREHFGFLVYHKIAEM